MCDFCFLLFYLCLFWSGCPTSLGCKGEKYTPQFSHGQVLSQNQGAWKCFWVCPVSHGTLWHWTVPYTNDKPASSLTGTSSPGFETELYDFFAILISYKPYADLWALSKILMGICCPVQKRMGKKRGKPYKAFTNPAATLNTQRLMSDEYSIMCLRSAPQSKVMFCIWTELVENLD